MTVAMPLLAALEAARTTTAGLASALRECEAALIDGRADVVEAQAAQIAGFFLQVRELTFQCEDVLASLRGQFRLPREVPFATVCAELDADSASAALALRADITVLGSRCAIMCQTVRRLAARRLAGVRRSLDFFNRTFEEFDVYGAAGQLGGGDSRSRFVTEEV